MSINLARVQSIIDTLASMSSVEGELTRLAFSREDEKAHKYIVDLCQTYDLAIRRDEIGNLLFVKQVLKIICQSSPLARILIPWSMRGN